MTASDYPWHLSLMVNWVPVLFAFAFGACVGSLLNVLVYRLPRGLDVVSPPSRCPLCSPRLTWRENVPVFGWLSLGGKCRFCRSPISAEYPLIEALVGLMFVALFAWWYLVPSGPGWLGVDWGWGAPPWTEAGVGRTWPMYVMMVTLLSCLIAATLIDARTFMIPALVVNVPTAVGCEACNGTGAEAGSEPTTGPTCSGLGKVRAQQGFFTVERTCPTCNGLGQIIKNPCKVCGGAGRVEKNRALSVNITAGDETGTRIRLAGEGEAGLRGGPQGDLYIFIEVEPHPLFERDGVNLHCRVPVSLTDAALGGEIEVPTIDGGRSRVKVPAGAQSGKQMRLRGKGMPALRGGITGDMFIEMAVETPVNLTSKQKELLREFAELSKDINPESSSFFNRVKSFWDGMKS